MLTHNEQLAVTDTLSAAFEQLREVTGILNAGISIEVLGENDEDQFEVHVTDSKQKVHILKIPFGLSAIPVPDTEMQFNLSDAFERLRESFTCAGVNVTIHVYGEGDDNQFIVNITDANGSHEISLNITDIQFTMPE